MATYKKIQVWVKDNHGFMPKSCWIAHAKELSGIHVNKSPRREGERKIPCPPNKLKAIQDAFSHFRMI